MLDWQELNGGRGSLFSGQEGFLEEVYEPSFDSWSQRAIDQETIAAFCHAPASHSLTLCLTPLFPTTLQGLSFLDSRWEN